MIRIDSPYPDHATVIAPEGKPAYFAERPFCGEEFVRTDEAGTWVYVRRWRPYSVSVKGSGHSGMELVYVFISKVTRKGEPSRRPLVDATEGESFGAASRIVRTWIEAGRPTFYGERE